MKIKTNELTEDKLGFVVALLEYPEWKEQGYLESTHDLYFDDGEHYAPWKNWAQAGPIIERNWLHLTTYNDHWVGQIADDVPDGYHYAEGETPLIAAMRCYVASKLGDEVEIPDELTEGVMA